MKKLFLLLIMALTLLTSCDIAQTRGNLKNYILKKESSQMPVRVQNYSINNESIVDIKIDSVSLSFLNDQSITPLSGYIATTWKFKKEYLADYTQYPMFSDDEYNSDYEFEYKKYLVPLVNFSDPDATGNYIEYFAEWPLDTPFKK